MGALIAHPRNTRSRLDPILGAISLYRQTVGRQSSLRPFAPEAHANGRDSSRVEHFGSLSAVKRERRNREGDQRHSAKRVKILWGGG
jgi:hypothetical protein